jgi:hypothetical protein
LAPGKLCRQRYFSKLILPSLCTNNYMVSTKAPCRRGTYIHLTPTGEVTDRHACFIEIAVRGERYSQRNTYEWADGRVEVHYFPGILSEGKVVIDTPRLSGTGFEIDEDSIMFHARFKDNDASLYDFIRALGDSKRARTWQVCKDGAVSKLVHVEEERVASESEVAFMDM